MSRPVRRVFLLSKFFGRNIIISIMADIAGYFG